MNHAATEIKDGKDLLGQPVHFPVNAEKLLSTVRFFFKDFVQSKPNIARKLQLKSIPKAGRGMVFSSVSFECSQTFKGGVKLCRAFLRRNCRAECLEQPGGL